MYRYEEKLRQFFKEHHQELVDLMITICQIPAPSNHEEKRAAFCKEWLEKLEEEYILIRKRLEEMCTAGEINEYIKCTLLDMTKKVIDSIAKKYENVREGVKQVVGGKILEYEAKDILRRGISQGRQEGELNICIRLIQDGLLKVEDAARKLNMEEEELEKRL